MTSFYFDQMRSFLLVLQQRCKYFNIMNSSIYQDAKSTYIYIRNYKKLAVILPVRSPTCGRQLRQLIKNKYLSQINNFAIFFKGKMIEENETPVVVQTKSIIHLVDLDRVNLPHLNIFFKVAKDPTQVIELKVSPQVLIRDVMRQNIKPVIGKGQTQIFFVYLGKPINIFKKFEEEFIEHQSEILIVEFKKKGQSKEQLREIEVSGRHGQQKADIKKTVHVCSPAIGSTSVQEMNMIKKNSKFQGFNPHPSPSAAPGSAAPCSATQIFYDGNLAEISPAPPQNPQKGGPTAQIGDTIFSAEEQLPQTQNISSEVAKEMKQSLKKSKEN